MNQRRGWWIPLVLAMGSVLFAYVGAYYALCVPSPRRSAPLRVEFTVSQYRVNPLGQHHCVWLFAPVHQLDRRIRPNVWYCRSY
jgi:hypothetical protein